MYHNNCTIAEVVSWQTRARPGQYFIRNLLMRTSMVCLEILPADHVNNADTTVQVMPNLMQSAWRSPRQQGGIGN